MPWTISHSISRSLASIILVLGCGELAADSLRLRWSPIPQPGIARYELLYQAAAGNQSDQINAGSNTEAVVTGLRPGAVYHFAVAAVDSSGRRSSQSKVLSYRVPAAPARPVGEKLALVPRHTWKVRSVSSEEAPRYSAALAIDGDPATFWHTRWKTGATPPPHDLVVDLGASRRVSGFRYLPRQDAVSVGNIGKYQFHVSQDGVNWGDPVAGGTFVNTRYEKEVTFAPKAGRFVRLRSLSEVSGAIHASVAEFEVLQAAPNRAPVFAGKVLQVAPWVARSSGNKARITARDPDSGDAITYAKVSGPSWLKISPQGQLSGAPPLLAAGWNRVIVRATDQTGAFSQSIVRLQVTVPKLPLPWSKRQIGKTPVAGVAVHRSGVFTQAGAGLLKGRADQGYYSWRTLAGDGSITARVRSVSGDSPLARAGVMIRSSLAPNSRQVFIGINGKKQFVWARRGVNNGTTASALRGFAAKGGWVRLVRKGDTIAAYRSTNGTRWVRTGVIHVKLGRNCRIGLFTSGDARSRATASFSNVRVSARAIR